MITPELSGDAFLEDLAAADESGAQVQVWWMGQSGFLVKWKRHQLFIDPYLSDSLTEKYKDTDKPHTRMTERVIEPERLNEVELISSSHNHTDHLDADSILPMMQANPEITMLVPAANRAFAAERLGVEAGALTAIDAGDSVQLGAFTVHAIPAAHTELEQDEQGRHRFLGYIFDLDGFSIYHSGDCVPYDGLEAYLAPFDIDLALLPVNGHKAERRVAGNFNGTQAARLAKAIGAGQVVPCHIEMFAFNTETPDEFVAECERLEQPYTVMRNGGRLSLPRN